MATRIPVRDTELYVEHHGRGVPMFVLHGGLGFDSRYLRPHLDVLGDRAELIYVDLRGHGRSAPVKDVSALTHQTFVDDLEALRVALGHEQVLVFGSSYGAILALEYALAHPGHTRGAILCGGAVSSHFGPAAAEKLTREVPAEIYGPAFAAVQKPGATDDDMREAVLRLLPAYFTRYEERYRASFESMRCDLAQYLHSATKLMPAFDVRDRAKRCTVPALVITGEDDRSIPAEEGSRRLHEALPRSELAILERSGHFPFIDAPEPFFRTVRDWLHRLGV
jgi:proline iminopeptidase